jgi:hypothetical protein
MWTELPYERATFSAYADCIVASRVEVDSLKRLTPDVSWQCLPSDSQLGFFFATMR